MSDDWDEGYWCDVCHQKHYQFNPACHERRKQREYAESDEGKRALRELVARAVAKLREREGLS